MTSTTSDRTSEGRASRSGSACGKTAGDEWVVRAPDRSPCVWSCWLQFEVFGELVDERFGCAAAVDVEQRESERDGLPGHLYIPQRVAPQSDLECGGGVEVAPIGSRPIEICVAATEDGATKSRCRDEKHGLCGTVEQRCQVTREHSEVVDEHDAVGRSSKKILDEEADCFAVAASHRFVGRFGRAMAPVVSRTLATQRSKVRVMLRRAAGKPVMLGAVTGIDVKPEPVRQPGCCCRLARAGATGDPADVLQPGGQGRRLCGGPKIR